jgi:hypothetical protein
VPSLRRKRREAALGLAAREAPPLQDPGKAGMREPRESAPSSPTPGSRATYLRDGTKSRQRWRGLRYLRRRGAGETHVAVRPSPPLTDPAQKPLTRGPAKRMIHRVGSPRGPLSSPTPGSGATYYATPTAPSNRGLRVFYRAFRLPSAWRRVFARLSGSSASVTLKRRAATTSKTNQHRSYANSKSSSR